MNAFDKIIGYASIKDELRQISDTLKNREVYDKLGVSAPRGLLLYGEPGVGKSLMASAVIEDSGRKVFCCRKDSPNGSFVRKIKETFEEASRNAPSIVFLDDMDKFANGDEHHLDAEEYVTVQSCIDEAKEKQVFVLATANNIRTLPRSLRRAGRFDRMIEVEAPRGQDAVNIIAHYLKSKKCTEKTDPEMIARIMDGRSCAELETVINEAGLYAGYERIKMITMDHFMKACLRIIFHVSPDIEIGLESGSAFSALSDPNYLGPQLAYHEAGHAVISEVLCPESVTLVFAHDRSEYNGGFTSCWNDRSKAPLYWQKSRIISALGGVAALDHKFGISDTGCDRDLNQAFDMARDLIVNTCINGFHLHGNRNLGENSQQLRHEREQAVSAEIEKYCRKAKEILSLNQDFFEKVAVSLAQRKFLTMADIQEIKSSCKIVSVAI